MQPKKFLPAIFILALVIVAVDHAVIANSFQSWVEPLILIAHILIVFFLYFFLQTRIGVRASLVGAALFAVFPGHAYLWASGVASPLTVSLYFFFWPVAAVLAIMYERFYKFLKTQEALVRHLFLIGVYALIIAMIMMSLQINAVWKDSHALWSYRVAHFKTAQSMREWAAILSSDGKLKEAQAVYEEAVVLFPNDVESYLQLGTIYATNGQSVQVVKLFNKLLQAVQDDEDVYLRVMEVYGKAIAHDPDNKIYQEKREEMLAQYEQTSKRKKYTANDYFNLGFLYDQVGGVEQAMRYYRKAMELDPKHEKTLLKVAGHLKEAGDYKNAVIVYGRIIKLYPRATEAYLSLGIIYNAAGNVDRARGMYERVIKINPDNDQAYFNLGYLKEAAGEVRDALVDYEKAVELNPKNDEAYYNMGNVYASLGQIPEAIASYLKTIGINPKHLNAHVNLSILSYKAKDFRGAIHYLDESRILGYNPPEDYIKALAPYKNK